jgi:hypothetical protein
VDRRPFAAFALILSLAGAFAAGQPPASAMAPGSKLFVAPMEWQLDRFVTAEIGRLNLPVELVASADQADYVMVSRYQKLGTHLIAPGHYIQVRIVAARTGNAVWADEVNDFAVFFGRLRRHGPAKAAESIVKKLRNKLFGAR